MSCTVRCPRWRRPLALVLLAIIGVVSLWTPLAHDEIAAALVQPAEPVLVPAGAAAGPAVFVGHRARYQA